MSYEVYRKMVIDWEKDNHRSEEDKYHNITEVLKKNTEIEVLQRYMPNVLCLKLFKKQECQ